MTGRWKATGLAWFALASAAHGVLLQGDATNEVQEQQSERTVEIALRVSATGPGAAVTIDRGTSDGIAPGDEILFRPKDGGVVRGVVARAEERSSTVDLLDPTFVPVPGTRGRVVIPASRLEVRDEEPTDPEVEQLPPHPGWTNEDEEWSDGEPLLARVRAVRPEERSKQYGGRLTLLGDTTWTTEDDRSDALLLLGADLWVENPFGQGGTMEMDLSFDQYSFDTPDLDANDQTAFRFDRLSYAVGGTRFRPSRLEVGRFLQHGMPELGVVDGVEYERRFDRNHRAGMSLGYMPEPDVEFESFDDLQVAGFYEWTVDGRADLSMAAAMQKTWHNGSPDRDLLVGRLDYLPDEGWDARAAAWLDFYDSGDPSGSGMEVTQLLLSTSRRYERDWVDVTFRHLAFPDLLRDEYVESVFEDLADAKSDRIAATWHHETSGATTVRSGLGLWKDEDERGGDVELGVDVRGFFHAADTSGVEVFATRGAYSTDGGMRFAWSLPDEDGRWDLSYRFADRHMDEFSHESDDLWEHAVRGGRAFHLGDGWHASLAGEVRSFDEELDLSATFYVQKSF